MSFRDVLKGAFKIATAIFLSVLALAVVGGILWKASDFLEKEAAKQYETPKEWSVDLTKNLQVQVGAKTKVVGGQLFMSIRVDGYPAYFSEPPLSIPNSQRHFTLSFADKDGFKLFEKDVPLNEMTKILGANGKVGGLEYQFNQYTGVDDYSKFAKLNVGWNFEVELPKAVSSVDPVISYTPDHCAPNLTRKERLRRLGLSGAVRETGYGEFTAGSRSILLSEETVISCM